MPPRYTDPRGPPGPDCPRKRHTHLPGRDPPRLGGVASDDSGPAKRDHVTPLPYRQDRSHTLLGAHIRQHLDAARCPYELAWLLDEELSRGFAHHRPHRGLCECEMHFSSDDLYWWPYPEDKWEPHPP